MKFLRTPDEAFDGLVDYPFAPNYVGVADGDGGSLRVHYLDEGPADGPVALLVHGEPSWSYLYRHMIPGLVAAGHRCVAPDLVGFGRSDKPTELIDYTYARHVEWMRELLFDHLQLSDVTFFGQDWGGLVGLRLIAEHPERYRAAVVSNTGMPTGKGKASQAFLDWQQFSRESPVFPIGSIIKGMTVRELSPDEILAYDAPFPDEPHKAGARQFPSLVPTTLDDPAAAANQAGWAVLAGLTIPFVTCFGDSDPITGGGDGIFQHKIPGAAGQPHTTIENGGHFIQEDAPDQLVEIIIAAAESGA